MLEHILENVLSSVCDINRYYLIHIKSEVKIIKSIIYDFIKSDINHLNYNLN